MDRRRRAVDAEAGLVDVAPLVLAVAVGILGAEEDRAGHGVDLGHRIEDVRDVPRAALAVGCRRQEHAELVDLEQDRRLPVHRGQQPGARGDLVAAEVVAETGFDEQLGDDLAAVVLAGA